MTLFWLVILAVIVKICLRRKVKRKREQQFQQRQQLQQLQQLELPVAVPIAGQGRGVAGGSAEYKQLIQEAISVGAPTYNKGKKRECAAIYDAVLQQIANSSSNDASVQFARTQVQQAKAIRNDDDRAWAL